MKVDKTNYENYYFYNNEHIGFLTKISYNLHIYEYALCELSTEDKDCLYYSSDRISTLKTFKTVEEALHYFKENNFKVVKKVDYLSLETNEDKISLSNTETNFLTSILKVLRDSDETKHYCKNIANSILQKIES